MTKTTTRAARGCLMGGRARPLARLPVFVCACVRVEADTDKLGRPGSRLAGPQAARCTLCAVLPPRSNKHNLSWLIMGIDAKKRALPTGLPFRCTNVRLCLLVCACECVCAPQSWPTAQRLLLWLPLSFFLTCAANIAPVSRTPMERHCRGRRGILLLLLLLTFHWQTLGHLSDGPGPSESGPFCRQLYFLAAGEQKRRNSSQYQWQIVIVCCCCC